MNRSGQIWCLPDVGSHQLTESQMNTSPVLNLFGYLFWTVNNHSKCVYNLILIGRMDFFRENSLRSKAKSIYVCPLFTNRSLSWPNGLATGSKF